MARHCVVSIVIGTGEYRGTVECTRGPGFYAETNKLPSLVHQLRRHLAAFKRLDVRRLSLDMRQPRLSLAQRLAALGDCLPLFREVEKKCRT